MRPSRLLLLLIRWRGSMCVSLEPRHVTSAVIGLTRLARERNAWSKIERSGQFALVDEALRRRLPVVVDLPDETLIILHLGRGRLVVVLNTAQEETRQSFIRQLLGDTAYVFIKPAPPAPASLPYEPRNMLEAS